MTKANWIAYLGVIGWLDAGDWQDGSVGKGAFAKPDDLSCP